MALRTVANTNAWEYVYPADGETEFWASAWAYIDDPTPTANNRLIQLSDVASTLGHNIFINSAGNRFQFSYSCTGTTLVRSTTTTLSTAAWQHIYVYFDGTVTGGVARIDDVAVSWDSVDTDGTGTPNSWGGRVVLANRRATSTSNQGWRGRIEDVAIGVGYEPTAGEVSALAGGISPLEVLGSRVGYHYRCRDTTNVDVIGGVTPTLSGSPVQEAGPYITEPGWPNNVPPVVAAAGTRPQGPLNHPFVGAFGGPI